MSSGVDDDGLTALTRAARSGNVQDVQSLIDTGAVVNGGDHRKVTPLIAAIGNIACMDILVKAGAQLNPKLDKKTRNPLLEAVGQNDVESVKFLMEKGAKVPPAKQCELYSLGCFDTNVETAPLWSTITSDNIDMFKALVEGGADLEDGIRATAYYAHYRGLELMIGAGANVNCVDEDRNTVLMRAAYEFDKDNETTVETRLSCVKLILKAGARVNKTNRQGKNALDRCLYNDPLQFTEDIARLLFAAGEKIRNPKPKSDILKKLKEEEDEMSLLAMCRKSIRAHLLDLDPHLNLLKRIPKFRQEVPLSLKEYMLFGCVKLDDEKKADNDKVTNQDIDNRQ